jgi:acetate kinase
MKVLVINTGSSSIKYQLFQVADWAVCASGSATRIGEAQGAFQHHTTGAAGQAQEIAETLPIPDHAAGLGRAMEALRATGALREVAELAVVGHRVVHGGEAFSAPTRIDDAVVAGIRSMAPLAPLHNPANLEGILVARRLFPRVPQVAVFDTAFHQAMPPAAYRYAIPEALYREHRVRRYGFHGTSHQYVVRHAVRLLGKAPADTDLVTLHLGNGASAAAVHGGRSVDTSMGMTPLEGLVMGTRSGDLDPAIHFYLCRELGYGVDDVDRLLNKESGLLGLAGVNDMREIHRLAEAGQPGARLAREVFALRIRKYLGAYYAELGRLDAVVFTGGIGENDPWIRARVCGGLETLGIHLDPAANQARGGGERDIAALASPVRILVVPTNEELEIARQAWGAVANGAPAGGAMTDRAMQCWAWP